MSRESVEKRIRELVPELIKNKHVQLIKSDHSVEYFTEYYPIYLEHILMAIASLGNEKKPCPIWAIDTAGEFFDQSTTDGSPIYLDVVYDLSKPFTEQSEELYKFLNEILNPELLQVSNKEDE